MNKLINNCLLQDIRCKILIAIICILGSSPTKLSSQLYSDASENLPDNGAKGQSMDVRAHDLDHDGDLDIVLANEFQPNTILINDGHGVFTRADSDALPQENHDSEDIVIADFNMDTHPDILFCSEDDINLGRTDVHEFYLGDGTGKFTNSSYSFPDSEANAILSIDFNSDQFPDVMFGNKGFNRIYINQGDGTFVMESQRLPQISRTTQDLNAADIDGDGDFDIMEGNEDGIVLLLNDGTGIYSDITATHLPGSVNMETRKVTFGDVDQDEDADIFLSNVAFIQGKDPQNRLYLNDGTGHFTDATDTHLPVDSDHTIDAIFEDVDLDSDPDLMLGNVFGAPVKIYQNDGEGKFTDATNETLGQNYFRDALGVISADLNMDSLRDLYICDRFMAQSNRKDLLLLRIPVSGIETKQSISSSINIYPNPVSDEFFVESSLKVITSLRLENMQGQLIDTIILDPHKEGVYKGSVVKMKLFPGMYVMHFYEIEKKVMVMIRH